MYVFFPNIRYMINSVNKLLLRIRLMTIISSFIQNLRYRKCNVSHFSAYFSRLEMRSCWFVVHRLSTVCYIVIWTYDKYFRSRLHLTMIYLLIVPPMPSYSFISYILLRPKAQGLNNISSLNNKNSFWRYRFLYLRYQAKTNRISL